MPPSTVPTLSSAFELYESEPSTQTMISTAGSTGGGASPHSQSPLTAIESSRAFVATARVEAILMLYSYIVTVLLQSHSPSAHGDRGGLDTNLILTFWHFLENL